MNNRELQIASIELDLRPWEKVAHEFARRTGERMNPRTAYSICRRAERKIASVLLGLAPNKPSPAERAEQKRIKHRDLARSYYARNKEKVKRQARERWLRNKQLAKMIEPAVDTQTR